MGVTFVLLDGVMIATELAECTAGREQLCSDERRFRAQVKESVTKDLTRAGQEVEFARK